jgi:hypothetical protein
MQPLGFLFVLVGSRQRMRASWGGDTQETSSPFSISWWQHACLHLDLQPDVLVILAW